MSALEVERQSQSIVASGRSGAKMVGGLSGGQGNKDEAGAFGALLDGLGETSKRSAEGAPEGAKGDVGPEAEASPRAHMTALFSALDPDMAAAETKTGRLPVAKNEDAAATSDEASPQASSDEPSPHVARERAAAGTTRGRAHLFEALSPSGSKAEAPRETIKAADHRAGPRTPQQEEGEGAPAAEPRAAQSMPDPAAATLAAMPAAPFHAAPGAVSDMEGRREGAHAPAPHVAEEEGEGKAAGHAPIRVTVLSQETHFAPVGQRSLPGAAQDGQPFALPAFPPGEMGAGQQQERVEITSGGAASAAEPAGHQPARGERHEDVKPVAARAPAARSEAEVKVPEEGRPISTPASGSTQQRTAPAQQSLPLSSLGQISDAIGAEIVRMAPFAQPDSSPAGERAAGQPQQRAETIGSNGEADTAERAEHQPARGARHEDVNAAAARLSGPAARPEAEGRGPAREQPVSTPASASGRTPQEHVENIVSDGKADAAERPARDSGSAVTRREAEGRAPAREQPVSTSAAPAAGGTQQRMATAQQDVRLVDIPLTPSDLGVVTADLRASGSGVEVKLQANNPDTARLLKQDQARIAEMLRSKGVDTADLTVVDGPVSHAQLSVPPDSRPGETLAGEWVAQRQRTEEITSDGAENDTAERAEHRQARRSERQEELKSVAARDSSSPVTRREAEGRGPEREQPVSTPASTSASGSTQQWMATAQQGLPLSNLRQVSDAIGAEIARMARPTAGAGEPARAQGPVRLLDIQLNPSDLGIVTVRLRVSGSGLEVKLQANNPDTARLLKQDQARIAEMLRSEGVDTADVTVVDGADGAWSRFELLPRQLVPAAPAARQSEDQRSSDQRQGGDSSRNGRHGDEDASGRGNRPGRDRG